MKMENVMAAALAITAVAVAEPASAAPMDYAAKYKMEQVVFSAPDGQKLNYCRRRIGDWSKPGDAPVILLFHGAGERGNDNQKQLIHGAAQLTGYCEKNNVKALLLFPQCPDGQQWVDTPWNLPEHRLPAESKAMKLAMKMLDSELAQPGIDKKRVYVCGLSMGGFGTWDAISRYPEKFAAAMPICGGVDIAQTPKFKDLPIRIYHGDSDTVVLTKRSRDAAAALTAAGAKNFTYVEVPQCGHGSWGAAFGTDGNWQWMLSQKRP